MKPAYRPDIDGLRTLAVVPVVLFHAGVPGVSGGYVGVDIFFVISGYLITAIIHREIAAGVFSFTGFYERRARRILPALIVMVLATLAAGYVLQSPAALQNTGEAAIATVLSLANVYFFLQLDYFAQAAEFRPLLHTWSLAVEEQFYIVWPILLVLFGAAVAAKRTAVVLTVLALSFAASVLATGPFPSASYYLLPTRAWELMLGAVLALGLVPPVTHRLAREGLACAGIVMIAAAVTLYGAATPFPGAAALLPCLGTVLLIHTGEGTRIGMVLATRPFVFVGLISYSLYLWHWPPLALARGVMGSTHLSPLLTVVLLGLVFVLAVLSWRYVERPFRSHTAVSRTAIFALSGGAAALSVALAFGVVAADGVRARFPSEALARYDAAKAAWPGYDTCLRRRPPEGLCRLGAASTDEPTVLLWGDSHAGALAPALHAALTSTGTSGALAFHNGCLPLPEARRSTGWQSCRAFTDDVLTLLEDPASPIKTVVMSGRWALNVTGERAPGEAGPPVRLIPDGAPGATNAAIVRAELTRLTDRLADRGIKTVFVADVPEIGRDVPEQLLASARFRLVGELGPARDKVRARTAPADAILADLSARNGVTLVDVADVLCRPVCALTIDGQPLYQDDDHLSATGAAAALGPVLAAALADDIASEAALKATATAATRGITEAPSLWRPGAS